jgi:hypothetical protein
VTVAGAVRGGVQLNGSLLRLNSLVFRVGSGGALQNETVAVIRKGLDGFRDDFGVEIFAVEDAMNMDANLIAGFGMGLGRLATHPSLRDLPKIDLLFRAKRSLGSNGSGIALSGDGIDLPLSGTEGKRRFYGLKRDSAERQQKENGGNGFCGSHGTDF